MMYLLQLIRIIFYKIQSRGTRVEGRSKIRQPVLFSGAGTIKIKTGVVFGVTHSPYYYSGYSYVEARGRESEIRFGENVWINNNLVVISDGTAVEIGDEVMIGWGVQILAGDFHETNPYRRKIGSPKTGPVTIGRNVWIGSNVTILKGVEIGDNSIIASNSVVVKNIPSNVIVGGVPATILRDLGDE